MKIGLFGGTFDPVHNAHIKIAERSINEFALNEVWFLADRIPRKKTDFTDHNHRLVMLKEATEHNPKLICDILNHNVKTSYNSRFFKDITTKYPDHSFFIILGADSARHLSSWDDIEYYRDKATFIIVGRNNEKVTIPTDLKYHILSLDNLDISSSKIRDDLNKNKSHLDKNVYKYILNNKLYI